VTPEQFCEEHPLLYHMATADALTQIEKYGLLSTNATLSLLSIEGEAREKLISQRRPESVILSDAKVGKFVLRDQIPMRDAALEQCLKGMTVPEWYRTLNERVFMWATRDRVEKLLGARAYRGKDHLVLTIDTKKVVADHAADLRLSSINSGATLYVPPERGPNTFAPLQSYEELNGNRPVVEVTVVGSIPKMREYILDAQVRKALLK
jgi:hypothetical protein